MDTPPAVPPADASGGGARALQLRNASFPVPDGTCSIHMQGGTLNDSQQQFGDMMLPSNGYSGNNSSSVGGGSYSASLLPPPTYPLSWCHGLSSDVDYYGAEMVGLSALTLIKTLLQMCRELHLSSYL